MKIYQVNGKSYTENEVIAIHDMWQDIQNRDLISVCIELALAMIGDDEVSEYARNNEPEIMEQCLAALPEWGVWQDECLSQNSLLHHYLVADKLKDMYESHSAGGSEWHEKV